MKILREPWWRKAAKKTLLPTEPTESKFVSKECREEFRAIRQWMRKNYGA